MKIHEIIVETKPLKEKRALALATAAVIGTTSPNANALAPAIIAASGKFKKQEKVDAVTQAAPVVKTKPPTAKEKK